MKNVVIFSILILVLLIPVSVTSGYAQQTYKINIPTGASSPDAPYFWQSEKDGKTDGTISIRVLDTVLWGNADTAAHTITSGTPETGPDEVFDSSLFGPGKSFQHQFMEVGDYPYYCVVHPWMTGVVTVTSGLQMLPNVGSDAGDGTTTFNVEYEFNRVISTARVDETQNSITFEIVGKASSDNNDLTLMLPKNLISGPLIIWVDGKQITNFELTAEGGINKVKIPLTQQSQLVSIVGTSVVPEFGDIAIPVLVVGVFSLIAISLKTKKFLILNERK